jgi:glycosyltransferase involved in cell wall biosynthesis
MFSRLTGRIQVDVSVVIPTYNDRVVIGETVAALLADSGTTEIVVVVDGSDDGSYELLCHLAEHDPRLRPFWIENRGRPGARQFGVSQATHEIIVLLDADVVPVGDMISHHARLHEEARPRVVVGHMPVARRSRDSFVGEAYSEFYESKVTEYEHDPDAILRGLWGGNVSLPASYIDRAGGFDGGLGIVYHDDLDFGLRLRATGIDAVFDRSVIGEHRFVKSVDSYLKIGFDSARDLVLLSDRFPNVVAMPSERPWLKPMARPWLLTPITRIGSALLRLAHGSQPHLEYALVRNLFVLQRYLGLRAGRAELAERRRRTLIGGAA